MYWLVFFTIFFALLFYLIYKNYEIKKEKIRKIWLRQNSFDYQSPDFQIVKVSYPGTFYTTITYELRVLADQFGVYLIDKRGLPIITILNKKGETELKIFENYLDLLYIAQEENKLILKGFLKSHGFLNFGTQEIKIIFSEISTATVALEIANLH